MKKALLATCVVCAAIAALAVSAAALQDDNGWLHEKVAAARIHRIERQLGITDPQREQIRTILRTEQPAIAALAAQVHLEQEQLRSQPTFDEAAVRAFARQHESTMEDVLVERERVRTEIMQVLTPRQRAQAEQLRKELYAQFSARLATLGDEL